LGEFHSTSQQPDPDERPPDIGTYASGGSPGDATAACGRSRPACVERQRVRSARTFGRQPGVWCRVRRR
jgi:hypothetical protein